MSSAFSHRSPEPPSPIDRFRTRNSRQKVHPAELRLLVVICVHMVFLPWALGSMRLWAQGIGAALAVLAFVMAMLPRHYDPEHGGGVSFRLYPWPKLFRFPFFWLGLVFLAYGTVGALNPAWEFAESSLGWWMEQIRHVGWLPTGVRVPFERWGPWRMLMIYASVWLLVCAAWTGFTRRWTLQMFFSVLAGNAFLLAALGIAQRATEADKIFWLIPPPATYFVASFTYKNHAGAYFNLLLGLCAGLAYWHYRRGERRLHKSSPAGLFAFFGTTIAMMVFFSYSRTATLLMFAFLLVALGVVGWQMFFGASVDKRRPWMFVLLVVAFVFFARIGLIALGTERTFERIKELQTRVESHTERLGANAASWQLAKARMWSGWGAGSFRFMFPSVQVRHPEILHIQGRRVQWEHAHNDYLELLAEFGVAGCAVLLAGLGWVVLTLVRLQAWRSTFAAFASFGCAITFLHCAVDFNLYNPAILTAIVMIMVMTVRWCELESEASSA